MKHYHGTPLGGTRESVARFVVAANRFFLVPYGRDEDLPIVADQSCGFCVDNGAFSAWKSGNPITNWQGYYNWCRDLQRNPRFDFAIIPDVIDGTEEQNKALFAEWFQRCKTERGIIEGAAVWHMHESVEYLDYLIRMGGRVLCIGSSGDHATPGTERWHERMA